jgi:tetratricopeptide (TPR) repeat protein/predicted RNA-binding Zn-ribbon protein involved in translation (DUF1610 family)
MFEFIKRLFGGGGGDEAPEPGSLVEELWAGELTGPEEGRFLEAREEAYSAAYLPAAGEAEPRLELRLEKPDLFAWTEAPLYRHSDIALEGEFAIPAGSPYSACGFLFRYQDEGNFYSVLVSNRGYFRLDVNFNGTPRALVAWTELPAREPAAGAEAGLEFSLRVIARGSHISLLVDDRWVAESVDETFSRGHIAFAGQCYGLGPARFELLSCALESRSVEVEAAYYRWNYYIAPEDSARRALAQTLFAMGESLGTAVQLRRIEKRRALTADEQFLKAEACLRLELRDEADAALDACLALDPGRNDAAEEKANLLYLRGRFLELRDALAGLLPSRPGNARLLCLSGHARFGLGDYEGAAADYRAAAGLEPAQALYRMNEARAWDQAGSKPEAADAYLAAARLFASQEADDDLALALQRLAALRPRSLEVKEIRATSLYRAGKREEAAKLLAELAAKGSVDSAVHYTLGLIQAEKGEGEKALGRFERALELEPDFALYAFRYAERLFLLGKDSVSAIARALELSEASEGTERGWTLNLAGQEALARGDLAAARGYLEAARAALPGRPEPAVNLADLESREGRLEAALAVLAPFPEEAACRNQAGNAQAHAADRGPGLEPGGEARTRALEAAALEYLRATILDPSSSEYQANLAAAYIELERYSEADDRVRKALDLGGGARALLLAGNLATIYGDYPRAETAYRVGLEAKPGDPALLFSLGRCYLSLGKADKASGTADKLEALGSTEAGERAARLRAEIEEATSEKLSCASCGRVWRVPRLLPPQSAASIRAMPPDEAPAGLCPSCGKVFCIACRKSELAESRFTCPDCGQGLKLSDDRLRYLVRQSLRPSR